MLIEFCKIEFGTSFEDTQTNERWVKFSETEAEKETCYIETFGIFEPNELVIV